MNNYQLALKDVAYRLHLREGLKEENYQGDASLVKLQELVDKETPIKVEKIDSNILFGDYTTTGTCPNCHKEFYIDQDCWYRFAIQYEENEPFSVRCMHCGNKLDFSEDE